MVDLDLIKSCANNERKAQSKLFEIYAASMKLYIRNFNVNESDIDDILNLSFIRIFKYIPTFSFNGSFEGWMRIIIKHAISDFYRYEKKRKVTNYVSDFDFYGTSTDNEGLIRVAMSHYNKIMKESLSEKQYKVLMLHYEGFPHKDIGEMLGLTVPALKWYLFEARKILKTKIKR